MTGAGRGLVVVGSLNVDTTSYVRDFPAPGETITAHGLLVALGGKGTNQAVAAHRFGADVTLVARTGADANARMARDTLAALGLSLDGVEELVDAPTGAAAITVADSGENTVIVASGANARLLPAAVDDVRDRIAAARVVLTQGELPRETIEHLAAAADAVGTRFVLNLAPSIVVSSAALAVADPLVVNEHEARAVGIAPDGDAEGATSAWLVAAQAAVEAGTARSVVITLGAAGAVTAEPGLARACPAPRVVPVDTTGAGDGFTGTLAAALAEGRPLAGAVEVAVAAGALAVQARGTVGSYAPREAVLEAAAAAAAATAGPATT
ncbi:ribokinase [Agromyces sp. MMS24-JH15]|uniref:ribokinase n=1 Tax=Agromyces sp. MMS24-JH15 TaxID=3243765 RepID=UPI003747C312